ncbi:uncharacterized protein PG998_006679 [Apiospora kogelbergensis]|uniref:uncharacterized protein n=1 Tax=Apiospora kogelbergensis TaxID=1337665 RepID=UPI0031327F5A
MLFHPLHVFAITAVAAVSFEWDCTKSLGTCNNACYAIYHNLAQGSLTYDSNEANRNPRRTASVCNKTPCTNTNYTKWGNSCDEFPFASTKEGGKGAILSCVDSTENSSEGGQLGNFYKKLKNGDKFDIFVKNYKGARFCDDHNAKNDGSEFKLSGSTFKDAKLRRENIWFTDSAVSDLSDPDDAIRFVDAEARGSDKPRQLCQFENEHGELLLSLNPDIREADAVGTKVWSNGNWTQIGEVWSGKEFKVTMNGTLERHGEQPLETLETGIPQDASSPTEPGNYSVFSGAMRVYLTYLLGFVIILSTLTATIYFPLIPMLSEEFAVSIQAINLTVTLYAICQGVTPPLFASLADVFGRRLVLLALVILYACASLGLAVNRGSYAVLLALRALQSIGGSATPAIAYGIVADVAVVSERGRMLGRMLGVVAQSTGAYTWVFYSLFVVAAVCFVLIGFTLPETSRNIVDDGSVPPPQVSGLWLTGGFVSRYCHDTSKAPSSTEKKPRPMARWRPIMLLQSLRIILYPDAAAVLWMIATSYCVYYTFQVAIPVIYHDVYGYNDLEVGLTFLPGLVGMTVGGIIAGKLLDRNFAIVARKHGFPINRKKAQEMKDFPIETARYRYILPFAAMEVILVAGYGWAVSRHAHPAGLLIMQFFICASSTLLSHTASALLVDIFPTQSSSSYAAGQLMRCGLSAASAAILEPLVEAVGRGWYFTIFAIFTAMSAGACVSLTRG